jgi:hypothetical protein
MKWIILVTFVNWIGQSGQAELEGRFDSRAQCETFSIMVASIYLARFKEAKLTCQREGEQAT